MRARAGRAALVATVAILTWLAGCAGRRLDNGVYRSEHGYRVTVPGPDWKVVESSGADLELRRAHRPEIVDVSGAGVADDPSGGIEGDEVVAERLALHVDDAVGERNPDDATDREDRHEDAGIVPQPAFVQPGHLGQHAQHGRDLARAW